MGQVSNKKLIEDVIEAYEKRLPLLIQGPPGIGKSDCVRQACQKIAERNGMKFEEIGQAEDVRKLGFTNIFSEGSNDKKSKEKITKNKKSFLNNANLEKDILQEKIDEIHNEAQKENNEEVLNKSKNILKTIKELTEEFNKFKKDENKLNKKNRNDIVRVLNNTKKKISKLYEMIDIEEPNIKKEKTFGMIDIRLSQCDPSDVKGVPFKNKINGKDVTSFLPPDFIAIMENYDGGIIFFDEITNAPPMVQAAAYQIILDRRAGQISMPKNWGIIAAGNRIEDTDVTFEMASPLRNRFIHVELVMDSDDWIEWAISNDIDTRIIAYIKAYPTQLTPNQENFDAENDFAFPTPRSWEMCSKLIYGLNNIYISNKAEMAIGKVGASALSSFIKLNQKFNIEDIINNPDKVKDLRTMDMSIKYAAVSEIVNAYAKTKYSQKVRLSNIVLALLNMDEEFFALGLRMIFKGDRSKFRKLISMPETKHIRNKLFKIAKDLMTEFKEA